MAKTIAPTGLSITRENYTFTCEWKIGDTNYDGGQRFWYRLRVNDSWKSWVELTVASNVTSKAITIDDLQYNYFPNTSAKFYGIQFCVRGKRTGYDWSSDTYCTFSTLEPRKPTVSSTLTNSNVLTISYDTNTTNYDEYIFMHYDFQTMLLENCDEYHGENLDWSNVAPSVGQARSGNYTITEDSSVIAFGSHTRWYRMSTVGVKGSSSFAYVSHTYAQPLSATITEASANEHTSGMLLDVTWNAPVKKSRPIDSVTVEYAKAIPIANMLPPANPSWQSATTVRDTSGNDGASVNISGGLEADQCLFTRVVTTHDNRNSYSNIALAMRGKLATPSGLNVTVSNNTATVRATNNSSACPYTGSDGSVKRLFLGITYKSTERYTEGIDIGVIPSNASQAIVTIPTRLENEEYTIEVKAYVGTYKSAINNEGISVYDFDYEMISDSVSTQGITPKEPTGLSVDVLNGTDAQLSWDWSWDKAEGVEISWSQDEYAWQSNEQPDTFDIDGYAVNWYIKGLETGKRYYARARFKSGDSYSAYSNAISFIMTRAPEKPSVVLDKYTVAKNGSIVVSWDYQSTDGSEQSYAEVVYGNSIIGHSLTSKYIKLYVKDLQWQAGDYGIKLRVKSASGTFSEYSDLVYVTVAPELEAEITSTSLVTVSEKLELKAMPLSVVVEGAGTSNNVTLEILRDQDYSMLKPNDDIHRGYADELVCLMQKKGDGEISVSLTDLLGTLDDGAMYRLVVTVKDGLGQVSTAEKRFKVNWTRQAVVPTGNVSITGTTAQITPVCSSAITGDVCDIYRLSIDKPELILKNGTFGTTYTDPYPAINGGYRIVFKTSNGDYTTSANKLAWYDIQSGFEYDKTIIDFGTDRVELYYNVDTNHSWEKDFKETKYLGGSIQGDINPAVSKRGNVTAVTLSIFEEDTIKALHRLAEYVGICNVRTIDGASYHANVNVNETRSHDKYGMVKEFSLNITRVDSQGDDAIIGV